MEYLKKDNKSKSFKDKKVENMSSKKALFKECLQYMKIVINVDSFNNYKLAIFYHNELSNLATNLMLDNLELYSIE